MPSGERGSRAGAGTVSIGADCLLLDRAFSEADFNGYRERIEECRGIDYYHRLAIQDAAGKRLETPGIHSCIAALDMLDRHGFPADLAGKTVLDVGCNAGFYSFVAKIRGARHVLGLEVLPHYFRQAELLREILGLDVEFRLQDGHDALSSLDQFDVVLNTGLLYHLQNPFDMLAKMAKLTRETMYLETEMLTDPDCADYAWFIEGEYCQDPTNWWIYGPRCVERMARAAGFADVAFRGFVWTPPPGLKTAEGFDRQGRGVVVCRK
jgi:SAM-dependent methyltransferase